MCCRLDGCSSGERPIEAVLFDLDDTLYPQAAWLDGAWERVASIGAMFEIEEGSFRRALVDVAAEGSDRGMIIDRALDRIGAPHVVVKPLLEAFRSYEPATLPTYPGVCGALRFLSQHVPIGLVTDGDTKIQRSKLCALRMQDMFDVVVISDELGRSVRKPHPAPLIRAATLLGVEPASCVYIGDRPEKDVAAARAARMRAVRVRTGEYAWAPDVPVPWISARDLPRAIDRLRPMFQIRHLEGASRR